MKLSKQNYSEVVMKKVDIYDFDKTMVPFDSGSRFWAYCLLHYPWIIIVGPYQLFAAILYFLGVWDLKKVKGPFFAFINLLLKVIWIFEF